MWWSLVPLLILPITSHGRTDCSKAEYDRCIRIADPLLKEPHLVFPDNIRDINQMCDTFNQFVDCLNLYTDTCFTSRQRKEFNTAVQSPIESVHQICIPSNYQREYLKHATCIKNTIIQRIHCGPQYNLLVDQVDQGDIISKSTLCCSQNRFKQCVQRETRRLCDGGIPDGPASRFAGQIIDKALKFLQDQCSNYIPNSGDCPLPTPDTLPHADRSDPLMISTSSSEIYPWNTIQQESNRKEILPVRMTPPRPPTTTSWLPSSVSPSSSRIPSTDASSTQILGSRMRPASYGRASSWSSESTPPIAGNTVQMYPEVPSTPSTRQEWATVKAWDVRGQAPVVQSGTTINPDNMYYAYGSSSTSGVSESTTWYPAAGNQLSNEVEEPNQLGLTKPNNNAAILSGALVSLITSIATLLLVV